MSFNWRTAFKAVFVSAMLFVLVLSLLPIDHPDISSNDKINHLIAYGFLMVSGFAGYRKVLWVALVVFFWGVFIEFLQGMTDYRVLSWLDVLANSAGIFIGCLLIVVFKQQAKVRL